MEVQVVPPWGWGGGGGGDKNCNCNYFQFPTAGQPVSSRDDLVCAVFFCCPNNAMAANSLNF